jgi:hypothetical protein
VTTPNRFISRTLPPTFALVGCDGGGGADDISSAISDVTTAAMDVMTLSSADASALVVSFVSHLSQLVTDHFLNDSLITIVAIGAGYGLLIAVMYLIRRIRGRSATRHND